MIISSFEKTNMASKTVRTFFIRLGVLAIIYALIALFYFLGAAEVFTGFMGGDMAAAESLLRASLVFFGVTVIFVFAFWELQWQILRTVVLATSLLSLVYLLCALLMLLWPASELHLLVLLIIGLLFLAMFVSQSNIWIYLRDRTYVDALIELFIALVFMAFIVRMIVMALNGGAS